MSDFFQSILSLSNEEKKIPEILAPAGGREQFFSALKCGADAVFLGLKEFNARARAENFSIEDLKELLPLARKAKMKVLVTLNILIKQEELSQLCTTLSQLEEIEVDAVIVQDLGVLKLIQDFFPNLRAHASTQLAVHNKMGALEAHKLGFRRIVLARELTKQEIGSITKAVNTASHGSTEIEAFCHGSLCYSYSGLCFFSGAKDSRSGNRGECAYTCRKPYKILNEPGSGFLFSMKDLSTADKIEDLADTGVHTLKIEGRKKDAQYVSTVVSFYRSKLNEWAGKVTGVNTNTYLPEVLANEENLNFGFQRKETSLFLNGRYRENVIDLNNPTHEGVLAGTVHKVEFNSQVGVWVLTVLNSATKLRLRDGVRVDFGADLYKVVPQHGHQDSTSIQNSQKKLEKKFNNLEVQFSICGLRNVVGRFEEEINAGEKVQIETKEDCSQVKVGTNLYKVRSSKLKEIVAGTQKIQDRLRKLIPISILAHLSLESQEPNSPMQTKITIEVKKFGLLLVTTSKVFPHSVSQNGQHAESVLRDGLELFGDFGFECNEFELDFETTNEHLLLENQSLRFTHIPGKIIKELKREIGPELQAALHSRQALQLQMAVHSVQMSHSEIKVSQTGREFWTLKLDRFELAFGLLKSKTEENSFHEICFEPKKAFLREAFSAELFDNKARQLFELCSQSNTNLRFAFPTVIRAWDEPLLKKWFFAFWNAGVRRFEIGNLGALGYLNLWKPENETVSLSSDFSLYNLNAVAAAKNLELGCTLQALSIETDAKDLELSLNHWPMGSIPQAIVYKDTPLFVAESCSLTALHNGCPTAAVCGYRTLEIENEQGEQFFVAHESCKSIVYGKEPYSLSHKKSELKQFGVSSFRIDLLTRDYSLNEALGILQKCQSNQKIENTHVANFDRVLL